MTSAKLSIYIILSLFLDSYIISCDVTSGREKTAKELVGTYNLDLSKTKLNKKYSSDSNIYKDLTITFLQDSTFSMNMDVPFFYNRTGKWKAGNVNEWCWMLFDSFKYDHKNEKSGSQFTRPYEEQLDTFFLINAATPRDNETTISDIYFRKVKTSTGTNMKHRIER